MTLTPAPVRARTERYTGIASLWDAGYDIARIAHTLGLGVAEVTNYIERMEQYR